MPTLQRNLGRQALTVDHLGVDRGHISPSPSTTSARPGCASVTDASMRSCTPSVSSRWRRPALPSRPPMVRGSLARPRPGDVRRRRDDLRPAGCGSVGSLHASRRPTSSASPARGRTPPSSTHVYTRALRTLSARWSPPAHPTHAQRALARLDTALVAFLTAAKLAAWLKTPVHATDSASPFLIRFRPAGAAVLATPSPTDRRAHRNTWDLYVTRTA